MHHQRWQASTKPPHALTLTLVTSFQKRSKSTTIRVLDHEEGLLIDGRALWDGEALDSVEAADSDGGSSRLAAVPPSRSSRGICRGPFRELKGKLSRDAVCWCFISRPTF